MKIYVSPSTQEKNKGAGDYGTEEKRMNQLADIVVPLLKTNGFTVYRNKPEMTVSQVVADSNKKIGDDGYHVAMHTNAGGEGEGTEIYHAGSEKGKELATDIYNEVAPITPSKDRGIKVTKSFAEVVKTKSPSILLETVFHDDEEDADFMIKNMNKIAVAIVKGICKTADVKFKTEKKSQNVHKVRLGDTLSQIARNEKTTVDELMKLNPSIKNDDRIYIGQTIKIPTK